MLVGGVIEDELCNHTDSAAVRFPKESLEIGQGAIRRVHARVVRGVVTIVLQWRWIERKQPDRSDSEILQVVEFVGKALEIADTIGVAIVESADVDFVDYRVLIPGRIVLEYEAFFRFCHCRRST